MDGKKTFILQGIFLSTFCGPLLCISKFKVDHSICDNDATSVYNYTIFLPMSQWQSFKQIEQKFNKNVKCDNVHSEDNNSMNHRHTKNPNVLKLREERNETQTKECDWNQATLVVIEWIHSNTHSFIFMILKRKRYSRLLYRYGTRYGVLWVCIGVSRFCPNAEISSQRHHY